MPLKGSAARVQAELDRLRHPGRVRAFAETTRTLAEAAQQIGCDIGQIAKSLVFRAEPSGRPVLVIASGGNRVKENLVEAALGERLGRADAAYVRERTGFAIGGVAPVIFIDRDLLQYREIWAAAGSPFAVFPLTPADLVRLTGGRVVDINQHRGATASCRPPVKPRPLRPPGRSGGRDGRSANPARPRTAGSSPPPRPRTASRG